MGMVNIPWYMHAVKCHVAIDLLQDIFCYVQKMLMILSYVNKAGYKVYILILQTYMYRQIIYTDRNKHTYVYRKDGRKCIKLNSALDAGFMHDSIFSLFFCSNS